ncbi:DNA polymerase-3 subunit epsilon [Robiginitalea myxolifaciens]|uniref:DNA polymerase-3 subunit epsilon n=1 Tax=Robiginitalea myxolifaciens TaxID=400055 RepID=A0A1I6HFQ0_9FLAO|nr:exonuclease domain-containing protein [Robiginitalea myxolifaciens]SFR53345.1 DNA polymerase-3 subunit epsilon [Robiginitalea myxolifaciens]
MYTVVDIETTGTGATGNRITEIALFNVDDTGITDSFSSLVNPGCEIPPFITGLTGITTAMVRNAPAFGEIAEQIEAFSAGRVFVAHSVNFDYPIVKREFAACGMDYSRKKLCTVRLSRKVFPGFKSYSLGKLCRSLDIPLRDRHRAAGDAHATALLLGRILSSKAGPEHIRKSLNARSQEATLPPHLPRQTFLDIPHVPGVYYFKDDKGKIIYVGKAIDLHKRVLGHFYDSSSRERSLCQETRHIDYETSGSEIMALIMEAVAIKRHFPKYNRAQKKIRPAIGLFSYRDQDGIRHLALNRVGKGQQALKVFYGVAEARLFLENLCTDFGLCAKYCHLQEGTNHCNHFRVPRCQGICKGKQSVKAYNELVNEAITSLLEARKDSVIITKGRTNTEQGLIWVRNGKLRGLGFAPSPWSADKLQGNTLEPKPNYPETERLLEAHCMRHPDSVIVLENSVQLEALRPTSGQTLTFF